MNWWDKVKAHDWRTRCTLESNCTRPSIICPICKHPAHKGVWVDLNSKDQIIIVARHAHFVGWDLREKARNWNHRIRAVKVDPKSFASKRVIKNREYLPADVRRIFDER